MTCRRQANNLALACMAAAMLCTCADLQSSLAKNIYEAVDRRIIQTDADIRRFEAELDRERKKYGMQTSKVREQTLSHSDAPSPCGVFARRLPTLWQRVVRSEHAG